MLLLSLHIVVWRIFLVFSIYGTYIYIRDCQSNVGHPFYDELLAWFKEDYQAEIKNGPPLHNVHLYK